MQPPAPYLDLKWFLFMPAKSDRKMIFSKIDMVGRTSYGYLKIIDIIVLKSDFEDTLHSINLSLDTSEINGNLL
jgi:hypothetical protein|tara:strand:+ start:229 stop:450 length:222 start_codon:yes stop_codon:yes gene_type:complete